jgi:hypothetical protein
MSVDLTTAEGAQEWIRELKTLATTRFREDGGIKFPVVAMLATRDEKTGLALAAPVQVMIFVDPAMMDPTGDGKDRLALYLRRVARLHDAIGYVVIMEVWTLPMADIMPRKKSWERVPGRGEALTIIAQHQALGDESFAYQRTITRDAEGRAKLAAWEGGKGTSGRFAGVLPSSAERQDFDGATQKLLAMGAGLTPEERRFHLERAAERTMRELSMPPAAVQALIRKFIAVMRERGLEVASRPEDATPSEATEDDDALRMVNIDEWTK